MSTRHSPWQHVERTAAELRARLGDHDVAVVLGSGWAAAVDGLGEAVASVRSDDLPAVATPAVTGHPGTLQSLRTPGGARVLAVLGRVHLYEGHDAAAVVHLCRSIVRAGVGSVVLTNAAGSLDPQVGVGSCVLVSDQLNLTATNPMVGPEPPTGTRFVDLSELYDPSWRARLLARRPELREGIYAGLVGGSFETPAEIRALRVLGADLVGMSTVLESVAAHHLGARVLGVSFVTNLAAGLQPVIDHGDVLAVGRAAAGELGSLLRDAVATAGPGGPG